MKDIENKIEALSAKIEKMEKQAVSGKKITLTAYILVIVFVFIYTNSIFLWMKQEVSANSLSASMRLMIENNVLTNDNRQALVKYCKEQAPVWADQLVVMTHEKLIPMMKEKVKGKLDASVDSGIAKLKEELFPAVKQILEDHASEFGKHKDITDPLVAQEIAKIIADECDREMTGIIHDKVKERIHVLRNDLDKLSSLPYSKLTRKQAAERRIIINWVYLMEHHEAPSDIFGEFIKSLNATYDDAVKEIGFK